LYLAYTLSFIDRQILALVIEPIRQDFQITDFQVSLIQGLAFAVFYTIMGIPLGFYTIMGIPLGRIADSHSRKSLVMAGVSLWSLMTVLSGLASNYWQLFLARMGVGVGEASLSPAAYSIISDSFPKDKRGFPINIYSAGIMCGAGLAYIFGGIAVQFAMTGGAQDVFVLGNLEPWQISFVLVGIPGIPIVLLMATIREPVRKELMSQSPEVSIRKTFRYIQKYRVAYGSQIVGTAFFVLTVYSIFSWVPTIFIRRFAWTQGQIGPWFGIIILVFGTAGLVVVGLLAQWLMRRGVKAPYSKLLLISQVLLIIPLLLMLAVDNPYWVLACLAVSFLFLGSTAGLPPAILQAITPNEMRGQITAVYLFAVNLIGLAIGPSAVAAMTDFYFKDDLAVGSSLVAVTVIASVIGVVILGLGMRSYIGKLDEDASSQGIRHNTRAGAGQQESVKGG
jgi:MFS family permease